VQLDRMSWCWATAHTPESPFLMAEIRHSMECSCLEATDPITGTLPLKQHLTAQESSVDIEQAAHGPSAAHPIQSPGNQADR
jgi:hypothetical protein